MKQTNFMKQAPRRFSDIHTPSIGWWGAAMALFFSVAPVLAQVAPAQVDPGALQRQEEERRRYLNELHQRKEAPPVILEAPLPAAPAVPLDGAKFILNKVIFGPSALLSAEELTAIADSYVGREIDFAALTALVEQVNSLYRARGIVTARAVLGAQKIENGIVRVTLVEAYLERIAVQSNAYTREEYLIGVFGDQQGHTLDTRALEDRMARFNHGGELRVEASLRPGVSPSSTDLMLNLIEPPRYQARAFLNNEGARSVGATQAGIDAAINGPLSIGDKLSLYVARTRGATSGALSYVVPVNSYGGHLSASYNRGITEVVAGPYRALGINGHSKAFQLTMTQPLARTDSWWFDANGAVGKTRSDNQIGDLNLSRTDIKNAAVGISATGAWEQSNVSVSYTATHAREQALDKPERSFDVRLLRASWVEAFSPKYFGVLRTVMQETHANVLTPSLLFQVGGVGSVRGYEVGTLSGDRGFLVNAEFHHTPREDIDASVFADFGQVRTEKVPNQSASSVGTAIDFQLHRAVRGNLTVARALRVVQPDQATWRVTGRLSYEF